MKKKKINIQNSIYNYIEQYFPFVICNSLTQSTGSECTKVQTTNLMTSGYREIDHWIVRDRVQKLLITGRWPRDNSHRPPTKQFPRSIVKIFTVLATASPGDCR